MEWKVCDTSDAQEQPPMKTAIVLPPPGLEQLEVHSSADEHVEDKSILITPRPSNAAQFSSAEMPPSPEKLSEPDRRSSCFGKVGKGCRDESSANDIRVEDLKQTGTAENDALKHGQEATSRNKGRPPIMPCSPSPASPRNVEQESVQVSDRDVEVEASVEKAPGSTSVRGLRNLRTLGLTLDGGGMGKQRQLKIMRDFLAVASQGS